MTKRKTPLRLDVHLTLNEEQMDRILAAFDDLAKALGHKEVKQDEAAPAH